MFLFKLFPFITFIDVDDGINFIELPNYNLVTDVKELIQNDYNNYEHFIQSFYNYYDELFSGSYFNGVVLC